MTGRTRRDSASSTAARSEATRADVEHGKPHPDLYLEAARRLGIAPETALAVEDSPAGTQAALERFGTWAFAALLATQVLISVGVVATTASGIPYSRSRDLAALLRREGLTSAVVMANPDVALEALPYYIDNPLWHVSLPSSR